jgi:biotin synthase-related radical SAM superfamily protein
MSTPWIPKFDEKYYVVSMDGMVFGRIYKDTEDDKIYVMSYNYYKTQEAAAMIGKSIREALYSVFCEILETSHPEQVEINRQEQLKAVGISDAEFKKSE